MTTSIVELPETFRPLRREEFMRLVEAGVFGEDRVELVGGVLYEMAPQKPPHAGVVIMLVEILTLQNEGRYSIAFQGPIELDEVSQPLPDFMVLPRRDYRVANPAESLLVIEVADSSLRFDLGEKARRYAMAGTPSYWVVDVRGKVAHVHSDPQPDGSWGLLRQVRTGMIEAGDLGLAVDLDTLFDF